jgi:hypothetical protein
MKVTAVLVNFAFVSASLGQDLSSIVSSALSVASSYVAENDMNAIVSSGLSVASSFVSANNIDSILSSFGSEVGITDSSGVSSAFSRATSFFDSLTDAFASNMSALITSTDGVAVGSSIPSETGSGEAAAAVTSTSADSGAADWSTPDGVAVGSFFLGLVAYL